MTTLLDVSGIPRPVALTGACQCWRSRLDT